MCGLLLFLLRCLWNGPVMAQPVALVPGEYKYPCCRHRPRVLLWGREAVSVLAAHSCSPPLLAGFGPGLCPAEEVMVTRSLKAVLSR